MRRVALLCVLFAVCVSAHAKVEATDDRGVEVTLDAPPRRIVSLLPSLSETVCGLGQCQRLVGVDRYSNYPASLRRLPQVGGGIDPNIEAIIALKPDLVLMSPASRVGERLEALGLKVFAIDAQSYADVRRATDAIGALLGVADPDKVWQAAQAGVDRVARSLPPRAQGLRVYYEVSRGPYAAGASSFLGETLARLGVQNIVPASLGPFPKLNPEYIVKANPDLIIVSQDGVADMVSRPGWSDMRAVRERRICALSSAQTDVVVRPGPLLAEGARILADCIVDKGLSK
ncbi:MAG TPA: helical backbone metal receptor [Bordetella sp.]|uniref:ABC transporter substrate-binding protein n=1 Tax=Bordetella sp. TaxID=28081 RepID=UPI002ED6292D